MAGLLEMILGDTKKGADLGKSEAIADQAKMANKMGFKKVQKKSVKDGLAGSSVSADAAGRIMNNVFKHKDKTK